VVLNKNTLTTN